MKRVSRVAVLCMAVTSASSAQTFTALASFTNGARPGGSLAQGIDGKLYGTTYAGGASGNGTIFKIAPSGKLTTLYSFCPPSSTGCADGANPAAGLVQGSGGYLYGTASMGGASGYYGTVFKITLSGKLTTMYSFCPSPSCADGGHPLAGLTRGADGDL
jgi:uncharacterized repeat protein (TIGR03803 family)